MESIKKSYYYFFYKLYKFWEYVSVPKFWSDWKASLILDCLIYFIVSSAFIYYKVFFNPYLHLSEGYNDVFILVIPVVIFNYLVFHHRDQWRSIIVEFDKIPKKKNLIGSWIVFSIVLLVILNLIYSFYLMSQIDWSQYR